MTQKDQLLEMFRKNNRQLTLSQIMQTNLACEYRARTSDLRRDGHVIICRKGKIPSENTYYLLEPEPSGQLKLHLQVI